MRAELAGEPHVGGQRQREAAAAGGAVDAGDEDLRGAPHAHRQLADARAACAGPRERRRRWRAAPSGRARRRRRARRRAAPPRASRGPRPARRGSRAARRPSSESRALSASGRLSVSQATWSRRVDEQRFEIHVTSRLNVSPASSGPSVSGIPDSTREPWTLNAERLAGYPTPFFRARLTRTSPGRRAQQRVALRRRGPGRPRRRRWR